MNLMKLLMLLRRNPDIVMRFAVNRNTALPLTIMPLTADLKALGLKTSPVWVPYLVRINANTVAEIARELFQRELISKEELLEYEDPRLFRIKGLITRLQNDPDAVYYTPLLIIRKSKNKASLDVLLITTNIDKPIVINTVGET